MKAVVNKCAILQHVVVYLLVYRTIKHGSVFKPVVYSTYDEALKAANKMLKQGFIVSIYKGLCNGIYHSEGLAPVSPKVVEGSEEQ